MNRIVRRAGDVPKRSLWAKLKDVALMDVAVLARGGVKAGSLERLEEILLAADFGVPITMRLVDEVGRRAQKGEIRTEDEFREELRKGARVIAKRLPGAPHESLLVLDGTIGQNAIQQAKEFSSAVPITGLVMTKLDGTARGGVVVAAHEAIDVPVKFLGVGEQVDDLVPFDAGDFARDLLDED